MIHVCVSKRRLPGNVFMRALSNADSGSAHPLPLRSALRSLNQEVEGRWQGQLRRALFVLLLTYVWFGKLSVGLFPLGLITSWANTIRAKPIWATTTSSTNHFV